MSQSVPLEVQTLVQVVPLGFCAGTPKVRFRKFETDHITHIELDSSISSYYTKICRIAFTARLFLCKCPYPYQLVFDAGHALVAAGNANMLRESLCDIIGQWCAHQHEKYLTNSQAKDLTLQDRIGIYFLLRKRLESLRKLFPALDTALQYVHQDTKKFNTNGIVMVGLQTFRQNLLHYAETVRELVCVFRQIWSTEGGRIFCELVVQLQEILKSIPSDVNEGASCYQIIFEAAVTTFATEIVQLVPAWDGTHETLYPFLGQNCSNLTTFANTLCTAVHASTVMLGVETAYTRTFRSCLPEILTKGIEFILKLCQGFHRGRSQNETSRPHTFETDQRAHQLWSLLLDIVIRRLNEGAVFIEVLWTVLQSFASDTLKSAPHPSDALLLQDAAIVQKICLEMKEWCKLWIRTDFQKQAWAGHTEPSEQVIEASMTALTRTLTKFLDTFANTMIPDLVHRITACFGTHLTTYKDIYKTFYSSSEPIHPGVETKLQSVFGELSDTCALFSVVNNKDYLEEMLHTCITRFLLANWEEESLEWCFKNEVLDFGELSELIRDSDERNFILNTITQSGNNASNSVSAWSCHESALHRVKYSNQFECVIGLISKMIPQLSICVTSVLAHRCYTMLHDIQAAAIQHVDSTTRVRTSIVRVLISRMYSWENTSLRGFEHIPLPHSLSSAFSVLENRFIDSHIGRRVTLCRNRGRVLVYDTKVKLLMHLYTVHAILLLRCFDLCGSVRTIEEIVNMCKFSDESEALLVIKPMMDIGILHEVSRHDPAPEGMYPPQKKARKCTVSELNKSQEVPKVRCWCLSHDMKSAEELGETRIQLISIPHKISPQNIATETITEKELNDTPRFKVRERLREDRDMTIDCMLVRLAKTSTTGMISEKSLIQGTKDALVNHFIPTTTEIEERIRRCVEREYLAPLDTKEGVVYRYVT